jgi:hypothetical protein
MFRIHHVLCALLGGIWACGGPAYSQASPGAIGGYTLGFVFDARSGSLRPLVGIPGAALLGAPLDAGVAIRQAYVSPRQNYAVALTDGDALVVSFHAPTDPPDVATLGFDSSAAGVAALSADGSAAAFYSVAEGLIRVVTGLPGAPAVAHTVPATAVAGTIRLLAIGNDGATLVAAVDSTGASAATLLDADGNGTTLLSSSHISALQFMGDTRDLLIADDVDDTVSLIQDVSGAALFRPLAAAADGIAGPIGLNISLDRNLVVVANGRAGGIFVLDMTAAQPTTYACPCTPAGLSRLNGNSVFLLNGISENSPLWLFDGDGATRRVLFIPADQGGTTGAGQ